MNRKTASITRYWLRVPVDQWLAIKYDQKREFRTTSRSRVLSFAEKPTPVITFRAGGHNFDSKLMVLEKAWKEPLGAISEESLAAEGHDTLAQFKVRWAAEHRGRFGPLTPVIVYRVRPWTPEDDVYWREKFFRHLYPEDLCG